MLVVVRPPEAALDSRSTLLETTMTLQFTAERYHDFSTGHRVYGHESKCSHLHGHNYRIYFQCIGTEQDTDSVGRVIDFSAMKTLLCDWLEENWDHKFLVYAGDPFAAALTQLDPLGVVVVDFNPTAENMAKYLLEQVCPRLLAGRGVRCNHIRIEETRKCAVNAGDNT